MKNIQHTDFCSISLRCPCSIFLMLQMMQINLDRRKLLETDVIWECKYPFCYDKKSGGVGYTSLRRSAHQQNARNTAIKIFILGQSDARISFRSNQGNMSRYRLCNRTVRGPSSHDPTRSHNLSARQVLMGTQLYGKFNR